MKLPFDFYCRNDVVQVSRELLGKVLYTELDGTVTAAIITETEAYACLLYTSPSPRDGLLSRMPSSA